MTNLFWYTGITLQTWACVMWAAIGFGFGYLVRKGMDADKKEKQGLPHVAVLLVALMGISMPAAAHVQLVQHYQVQQPVPAPAAAAPACSTRVATFNTRQRPVGAAPACSTRVFTYNTWQRPAAVAPGCSARVAGYNAWQRPVVLAAAAAACSTRVARYCAWSRPAAALLSYAQPAYEGAQDLEPAPGPACYRAPRVAYNPYSSEYNQ